MKKLTKHQTNISHYPPTSQSASNEKIPPPPLGTPPTTTSYMQLQAQQLLKLPTITENHSQFMSKKAKAKESGGVGSSGGKLKFSKVLSLSAQSLTNRFGVGSSVAGASDKSSSKKTKKTNDTASPGHHHVGASPMYTPPPTRRCNTLHHTPTVRKTFKTLQQLERQKLEAAARGELQITRTLHRIAGTHKTYWKYGVNSTANSIVGQHQQQKQQQQQHQQQQHQQQQHHQQLLLKQRQSITSELESNTSDELGSEETQPIDNLTVTNQRVDRPITPDANESADCDDSATDVGSCTVPLASDSIEMMNLMLSAAQSAVIGTPRDTTDTADDSQSPPESPEEFSSPPDTAIGTSCVNQGPPRNEIPNFPKYFTLSHLYQHHHGMFNNNPEMAVSSLPFPLSSNNNGTEGNKLNDNENDNDNGNNDDDDDDDDDNDMGEANGDNVNDDGDNDAETVAFESFTQKLARRKSFSGEKMRAHSLQRNSSLNFYDDTEPETDDNIRLGRYVVANSRLLKRSSVSNRSLLKSSSLDVPSSSSTNGYYTDFNFLHNSSTVTTINPLLSHIKTSVAGSKLSKTLKSSHIKQKQLLTPSMVRTAGGYSNLKAPTALQQLSPAEMVCSTSDDSPVYVPQHYPGDTFVTQHHGAMKNCHPLHGYFDNCTNNGGHCGVALNSLIIDDELEQHIKQCSCSCNHMGYGNSMDYQTTGFGGLPDVTEHSNIRRTISRQNSTSNSDSGGEIASIQKSKVNFPDTKSPTDSSDPIAVDAIATKSKRKSKASQQHPHNALGAGVHHKLGGRNSCVIALTLLVALSLLAVAATLLYQHFVMAPSRNSHTQRLKIVKRILRDVPLVDGHNNFAWNVRKYAHSSLELVHVSNDINHKSMWVRPAWAQTDMERLKVGQVGVQVWSAYVPCEAQGLDAVQLALEQIDIIRRLTDMYHQDTVLVQTSKDIQMAQRQGLIASLIGIEGGHAIGSSLGVLRSFYSLGARYLSLTHKCDVSWAGSSSTAVDAGLSQFGKAIIREMNRLGMMIDLSYSSDTTARDVLSNTRAPVIFSHSGARQLCNSTRNVPDDILRLVAENGGLIMISFDSEDVSCGRQARLKDVVDHIKYIRAIAGIQHIGLGAGYDGIELPPIGLEDVSKYPDLLAALLEDPNWSEEDVAMLAGKNFLRIMETVENVRDYWKRAAIQPVEQTEAQPKTQCTYMAS